MFAPLKRWASLSLAVGGVAIVMPVVGCDDADAPNKTVKLRLQQGTSEINKLDPSKVGTEPEVVKPAQDPLTLAATQSGAGPSWQATAASAAGDLAYHNANAMFVQLLETEQQIRVRLAGLRALAHQVAVTNITVAGQQKNDPGPTVAQINQSIAAMQGDASKPTWGPGDAKVLPTLAAVRQAISQFEGQISQRKEQIATLEKQRDDAIASSETLMQQSVAQKGEESVKTFRQATAARKTAEEARVALDLQNDQLKRLEADLAVAKAQEQAVLGGVARQQEQIKASDDSWTKTQASIKNQREIAKEIASGGAQVTVTIADTVKELTALQNAAQTQRAAITESLTEAKKQYEVAASAAQRFATSLGTGNDPQVKAAKEGLHVSRYKLKLGLVQREQGTMLANEARVKREIETTRASVQTALQGAGLEAPAELQSVELGVLSGMATEAETMLNAANETFLNISGGDAPKSVLRYIQTARLITLHRLIELQDLKTSPDQRESLRTLGRELRDEMINNAFPVPALPGELGVPAPVVAPVAPPAAVPEATPDATPAPAGGFGAPTTPATPEAPTAPAEPAAPAPADAAPAEAAP